MAGAIEGRFYTFEGNTYRLAIVDRREDGSVRVCELEKVTSDEVYRLEATAGGDPADALLDGRKCSCPDFRYRHAGQGRSKGCKHLLAMERLGLLLPRHEDQC